MKMNNSVSTVSHVILVGFMEGTCNDLGEQQLPDPWLPHWREFLTMY